MALWILYVLLGITHVTTEYFNLALPALCSKVLLLPVLMAAFRLSFRAPLSPIIKGILLAQLFSWFGDLLLIRSIDKMYFILGLLAFLVSHLAYILSFRKEISNKPRVAVMINDPWMVLPFIVFGLGMLWWMWDGLGSMRLPVAAYTTVITSMLAMSFNRLKLVSGTSFWLVFIGAALFVASDSMIAINRFIEAFNGSREAIMSTYIAAQFLIAAGLVKGLGGKFNS